MLNIGNSKYKSTLYNQSLRLSALIDLCIHSLKGLVIKILSSISNSPASIHPLYHSLSIVGSLITLSKYIHVTSYFKVFITTNLMVQSELNLILWFVSYNIFLAS
jgi:CRISPR/Cas system-associated exonuclease Cas4 (RecB family)